MLQSTKARGEVRKKENSQLADDMELECFSAESAW